MVGRVQYYCRKTSWLDEGKYTAEKLGHLVDCDAKLIA